MREDQELEIKIIVVGDELLRGDISDRNGSYIASELHERGYETSKITVAADDIDHIAEELSGVGIFFVVGGLGPTSDDMTREAIASATGLPLSSDADSLKRLEDRLEREGRKLTHNRMRQVLFPVGAYVYENTIGTADAFSITLGEGRYQKTIIALPGVPHELKNYFDTGLIDDQGLLPVLDRNLDNITQEFRVFGVPESSIGQIVDNIIKGTEIKAQFYPKYPEVLVKFSAPKSAEDEMVEKVGQIVLSLGEDKIFTYNARQTLPMMVSELATKQNIKLCCAESCTGGEIANKLVSIPGASAFFLASLITYSNDSKTKILNVPEELIKEHGAVSREVAEAMAKGALEVTGADLAVSTTGIAGPAGEETDKPVGLVWFAVADENGVESLKLNYPRERNLFRNYVSGFALDLIRRKIQYNTILQSGRKTVFE